jgi:nucleoside-diphosphate-sugar epimerase
MILVTGGTGLVGAHLLLHIIQDEVPHNLRCELPIDRLPLIEKTKSLFDSYHKSTLLTASTGFKQIFLIFLP